ncbi:MAG: hypothetical protein PVH19_05045 [Planctomycetia bacterium]
MNTYSQINQDTHLAKCLAAEDIRCGDMVTVLDTVYELPSFLWHAEPHQLPPNEPVHIRFISCEQPGQPMRVKAICLPYVFVKRPDKRHVTLDTRRCRLVRLSDDYARQAWKLSGDPREKNKKKRKKSKKKKKS